MKVIVAENCGFCPGVRNAISIAEKILHKESIRGAGQVYSLGPIIHNKDVVQQLAKKGLKTVNSVEEIQPSDPTTSAGRHKTRQGTVLIRSHGAPPEQIAKIKKKKLKIVDATCVLVKKVQKIAKRLGNAGYMVVVIGNENHPEVQAVVGCAENVIVVADESDLSRLFEGCDLHKLPKNGKLGIVCQTTQSPEYFGKMLDAIAKIGFTSGRASELKVVNTLCKEAIKRQNSAVTLCKQVDVMFVLGGLESANTCKLAEICKKYNNQTFHLQNWNEFDKSMLFGKNIAGVTAGASTPDWIITEFVQNLKAFDTSKS